MTAAKHSKPLLKYIFQRKCMKFGGLTVQAKYVEYVFHFSAQMLIFTLFSGKMRSFTETRYSFFYFKNKYSYKFHAFTVKNAFGKYSRFENSPKAKYSHEDNSRLR